MNILKNKNTVGSIISVKASESRIRLAIFTFLTLVSFMLLLVFSSQRWKLSPDKYWDGLPAKSQAIQWITLFDSKKGSVQVALNGIWLQNNSLKKSCWCSSHRFLPVASSFGALRYEACSINTLSESFWSIAQPLNGESEKRKARRCIENAWTQKWKTTNQTKISLHACTCTRSYPGAVGSAVFHSLWL